MDNGCKKILSMSKGILRGISRKDTRKKRRGKGKKWKKSKHIVREIDQKSFGKLKFQI